MIERNETSGAGSIDPRASLNEMERGISRVDFVTSLLTGCLFLIIVVYALSCQPPLSIVVLSVVGGIVLASGLIGGLLGFLFGIPRLLSKSEAHPAPAPKREGARPAGDAPPPASSKLLQGNSNLEEISDWVTKILVGLGLVNAKQAVSGLGKAAEYIADHGLGNAPGSRLIVLSCGIAAFLIGFLFAYLQTRTRITLMLVVTEDAQTRLGVSPQSVEAAREADIARTTGPNGDGPSTARRAMPSTPAAPVDADRDLLRLSFEDLRTPAEFAAWGAAQARARNYEAAETALKRANALAPNDANTLRSLAEVRALRGDLSGSLKTLSEATTKAPSNWRIRRIELLQALYLGMPESFRRAIPIADQLITNPDAASDPMIHVWRACAYGQMHQWTRKYDADNARSLEEAQAQALRSVKKAVELAPNPSSDARRTLRDLINYSADGVRNGDNDLVDFRSDKAFRDVILAPPISR